LALASAASNRHEAEAAERAARRVMEACNIDPVEHLRQGRVRQRRKDHQGL
jgi:hypothetical protein